MFIKNFFLGNKFGKVLRNLNKTTFHIFFFEESQALFSVKNLHLRCLTEFWKRLPALSTDLSAPFMKVRIHNI